MKTVAVIGKDGNVKLPKAALDELGVKGDTTFQLEVTDGSVVLTPEFDIPSEDAWAYTSEHLALEKRADKDVEEGRVRTLSRAELDRIAGD